MPFFAAKYQLLWISSIISIWTKKVKKIDDDDGDSLKRAAINLSFWFKSLLSIAFLSLCTWPLKKIIVSHTHCISVPYLVYLDGIYLMGLDPPPSGNNCASTDMISISLYILNALKFKKVIQKSWNAATLSFWRRYRVFWYQTRQ